MLSKLFAFKDSLVANDIHRYIVVLNINIASSYGNMAVNAAPHCHRTPDVHLI